MGEKSKRNAGWEWRVAGWMARHPAMTALPFAAAKAGFEAYQHPMQAAVAGGLTAAAGVGWYRGHPASWDGLVAPRLRSFRRRWMSKAYFGPLWNKAMEDCNLVTMNRSSGVITHPRVIRVKSHSPASETVTVRLRVGQTVKQFTEASEALAVALDANRVGVEKAGNCTVALIVQRHESFQHVIVPPEIVDDPDAVDLKSIYLGETEFGTDWYEPILGQHVLIAGASGSGKNSVSWMFLRSLAPLIRDGIVRLWIGNPKETEMAAAESIAYRYAVQPGDVADMIEEFWATMESRKKYLAAEGLRTFMPSFETPLDLLLIDELGAITGYGDTDGKRRAVKFTFPMILSQARSLGGNVLAALQEPGKDVLPQRDLFTLRIQMRAENSLHPDMTLGEDMRRRGALADEIPNVPESAGIGYVVRQRTRTPIRVRAAYCDDHDTQEVIDTVRKTMIQAERASDQAASTKTHNEDDGRSGDDD